jgi:hypothetical protein
MLDGRALTLPRAALAAAPTDAASEATSPAVTISPGSNRAIWILALLGFALLLILASVVSPVLARASRVFERVSERRFELAGVGLVVLTAFLVTGGAGL